MVLTFAVWLAAVAAGVHYGGHGLTVANAVGRNVGLHIRYIEVTGQKETSDSAIVAALGLDPSSSLLAVDADAARERLARLPWITSAEVRTYLPGVIEVSINETSAFARWDDGNGLGRRLIDREGRVLADWVEPRFAELPLVIGEDANHAAAEGIDRLAAHPEIRERLVAAVFVNQRRWDLMLEGGVKVQLPADAAADALAALAVLHDNYDLLDRAVSLIDLRLADRTTVELAPPPAPADSADSSKTLVRAPARERAI
jgi:cell division protein FtsQ